MVSLIGRRLDLDKDKTFDHLIIKDNISIQSYLQKLEKYKDNIKYPSFSVIIDKNNKLIGVVTDGDIRNGLISSTPLTASILKIASKSPVCINYDDYTTGWKKALIKLKNSKKKFNDFNNRFIPIIDDDNTYIKVLDTLRGIDGELRSKVSIYGLGYVGLTLAAHLSVYDYEIKGIDISKALIKNLKNGICHIKEIGLDSALINAVKQKNLSFNNTDNLEPANFHIIAVGTPVDKYGNVDLNPLGEVSKMIASVLRRGDHVMLRSTVPLGVSRNFVAKIFQKLTNLKPGADFNISFTPERTAEGVAMEELRTLPQIVGGFSDSCTLRSADFWNGISSSAVQMNSLEAAEFVKLINNSFRDLSFAFANEISLACEKFNINAFDLIESANIGYKRNKIAMPSPGVGGYCLTKDPYLYGFSSKIKDPLSVLGRKKNLEIIKQPLRLYKKYLKNNNVSNMKVLICGIAFKGNPETNDIRGSSSLDLANLFIKNGYKVYAHDFALSKNEKKLANLKFIENLDSLRKESLAVFFMNNHHSNPKLIKYLNKDRQVFIFDGWHQLNQKEISNVESWRYSTLGYVDID